ncbi:unnamed protein product [Rhizoctonia solani]|uniref:Uncharacterized protein n=1 Tax=Rhizoctonia solani TaxID=456999 RepID=A0A8H2XFZ4_9AGAM|nr:unnamed protein product [Rhizoctonia solani]
MLQVEPASMRCPTWELKKTPKQKQIDKGKALKDKQIAECTLEKQSQSEAKQRWSKEQACIQDLQLQAKDELENADATIRMMYNMGEAPKLGKLT